MDEQRIAFEQRLKNDFRVFLYLIWRHLRLPNPTPVQYEIAEYLQIEDTLERIVEGFRGVAKSWITAAYALWRLYCDIDYKILVVSASKDRANNFSTFTRMLINDVPFLAHMRGGVRDSNIAFDIGGCRPDQAPSVKSVGITGQLTGSRANEIIADDIEVPNNSYTPDLREKLLNATAEFTAIKKPGGRVTFLGTPQTEESVYNVLRERGFKCRIWPARYPSEDQLWKFKGDLAPSIEQALKATPGLVGRSTEPTRFTDFDLAEREARHGRSFFSLQYMLDTSLTDADKYPLKLSDLIIMSVTDKAPVSLAWASSSELQLKELPNIGFTGDRWFKPLFIDKEWVPFEGSVMAIDPSGRGQDELAYAVVKQLHGYLYVTAAGGLQGGYDDDNLVKLARIAKEQAVNYIVIEANFGDGMFTKIFSPVLAKYHRCSVEEVKHNIQKERRIIDTLEPVMGRHRLIVGYDVVEQDLKLFQDQEEGKINYSLFHQLTRLTKDRGSLRHDDRLDALSIAVAYWVNSMARDEKHALEDYKQAQFDKELENFRKHVWNVEDYDDDSDRWM